MILPWKVTVKGGACAIASATRPEGAPLTVTLGGETMPGAEDGPLRGFRTARCRVARDGRSPPAWR
jgi:hypothetical protein